MRSEFHIVFLMVIMIKTERTCGQRRPPSKPQLKSFYLESTSRLLYEDSIRSGNSAHYLCASTSRSLYLILSPSLCREILDSHFSCPSGLDSSTKTLNPCSCEFCGDSAEVSAHQSTLDGHINRFLPFSVIHCVPST